MKVQLLSLILLTTSVTFAAQEPKQSKLTQFLQRLQAIGKKKDKKEKPVAEQPAQVHPQPAICAWYKPNGEGFGLSGTRTLQNGELVDDPGRLPAPHLVCRYHEYGLPDGAQVSDNIDDCTCDA